MTLQIDSHRIEMRKKSRRRLKSKKMPFPFYLFSGNSGLKAQFLENRAGFVSVIRILPWQRCYTSLSCIAKSAPIQGSKASKLSESEEFKVIKAFRKMLHSSQQVIAHTVSMTTVQSWEWVKDAPIVGLRA